MIVKKKCSLISNNPHNPKSTANKTTIIITHGDDNSSCSSTKNKRIEWAEIN